MAVINTCLPDVVQSVDLTPLWPKGAQRDTRPAALQATLLDTHPHVRTQQTLSHMGVNDVAVCIY